MRRSRASGRAVTRAVWSVCERLERRTLFSSLSFNSVTAYPAQPIPSANSTTGAFVTGTVQIAVGQFGTGPTLDVVTASQPNFAENRGTICLLRATAFSAPE